MNRETLCDSFDQIEVAKAQIRDVVKRFGITGDYLKYTVFNTYEDWSERKEYIDSDNHRRLLKRMDPIADVVYRHSSTEYILHNYIQSLKDRINNIRSLINISNISESNISERYWKESQSAANRITRGAFPRGHVSIERSLMGSVKVEYDGKNYWSKNTIFIPVTWIKSVYERGIPIIHGTKGKLFVAHAERLSDVPEIDYELPDCTVFKVDTVRMRIDEAPTLLNGYLLVNNYESLELSDNKIDVIYDWIMGEDRRIHAFNVDLKKAAMLLNRRVKQEILRSI